MLQKLFNPDNPLMVTMAQITDCIFLSLFWLLGCFPVVTAGASTAALYDAVYHGFRKRDKHSWQRFLGTFKENLKGSILPCLIFLAVLGGTGYILIQLWNSAVGGTLSWAVFAGAAFFGVVVLGILSVLFPMLSRFENSFAALMKNTLFIALANLPRTVGLGILNAVAVFLCARFVIPLFFLPALAALIGTLLIEPMFRPYMNNDDEDAAA